MLQHLLCFLCPCQASDQHQELGREAAGGCWWPRSPFVTLQRWKDISCLSPSASPMGEGEKPLSDSSGGILVDKYGHLA